MTNWTNDQQKVISSRGTDLLVSASAGSGKTTVMIERIAALIEKKEIAPSEILVLTFTKESARDMKNRLARRLGDKCDVTMASVGTFHKFCSDLVQTYFSVVGVNPSFSILDESNTTVLQNEILDDLIEKRYIECSDAIDAFCSGASTQNLKNIIMSTSEFLCTRENPKRWLDECALSGYEPNLSHNTAMLGIVKHYREAGEYFCKKFMPDVDCFEWSLRFAKVEDYDDLYNIAHSFDKLKSMKTDSPMYVAKAMLNDLLKKVREQYILPKSAMIKNQDSDRELVGQVLALVREYIDKYASKKTEGNFLDFTDLEKYALEILCDPEIGARAREKYKLVFVDEYQDTNPVQERILGLLTHKGNKMFVVGDVKQSIYGFRGTEAAIFTDRMKTYEQGASVAKLNTNFRSDTRILGFVNEIFEKIMRETVSGIDYSKTSRFEIELIKNDEKKSATPIEIVVIEKGSAREEAAVIAEKISCLYEQGFSFSDIAVLARNSTHFDTLIDIFNQSGIPCITDKKQRVNEIFEIALLNNMLAAVFDFEDTLPAVLLMQSFVFGFTPDDCANIKLGKISSNLNMRYEKFRAFLEKYNKLCFQKNVVDIMTTFIAEYNIIDKLLITPNGDRRVRNIYNFLNKLRGSTYSSTVAQYLYLLENEMLDIEIESTIGGAECVKIMTIHSSKGLEFPVIFLYGAGANFSSAEKRKNLIVDKTCGMCVYSTDPDEYVKHASIARLGAIILSDRVQIAEEMRLLYVALTRAKNKLIIVGSMKDASVESSPFPEDYEILSARNYLQLMWPSIQNAPFLQILHAHDIQIVERQKEQRILVGKTDEDLVKELRILWNRKYPYENAICAVQKASVTSLTKREEDIVDIKPEVVGFSVDRGAEYGTLFHKTMQKIDFSADVKDMVYDNADIKNCATIVGEFIRGMDVYKELMFLQTIEKDSESVLVQGVIDLLAVSGERAMIIDYKTNRATPEKLCEIYKPQLDMYSIAVAQALGFKNVEKYIYSTIHKKIIKI